MGQKVHPLGFRIAVTEPWRSKWFATKKDFGTFIAEDYKIRRYVEKTHAAAGIERVIVERPGDNDRDIQITVYAARVGLLVGRRGERIEQIQAELEKLTGRTLNIKLVEVTNPGIASVLVGQDIATQIKKRQSYRRAIKRAAESAIDSGAKGIKILVSGRLGGAEIARSEKVIRGSIPLQTLQANIDYGFVEAATQYGNIGIKVWIYKGRYGEEIPDGANAEKGKIQKNAKRKAKR